MSRLKRVLPKLTDKLFLQIRQCYYNAPSYSPLFFSQIIHSEERLKAGTH